MLNIAATHVCKKFVNSNADYSINDAQLVTSAIPYTGQPCGFGCVLTAFAVIYGPYNGIY